MYRTRIFLLAVPFLALVGCSHRGRAQQPAGTAPLVAVHAPLADVTVAAGAAVEIRYTDDDPDTEARTDVVARSVHTFAEIVVAADMPEADGALQIVLWDTTGVDADDYEIEIRTDDGESQTVAQAPGIVTVTELAAPAASGAWADNADVEDMTVLPDGSIVVTGAVGKDTTLGEGQAGETTLMSTTSSTFFVARYDADGTLLWVRTAASTTVGSHGYAVDAFPDGSCVVIGLFGAETTFSPGRPEAETLAASPLLRDNAFVAHYGIDGTLLWIDAIRTEDNLPSSELQIAATPDGCTVVMGRYVGNVTTFNAGAPAETSVEDETVFVAKYDGTGAVLWARNAITQGKADVFGLAAFDDGSFVACGAYDNKDIVLGEGEAGETLLEDGGDNGWIARFDASGALTWARRVSTANGKVFFMEPDTTPAGAIVVSGYYQGIEISMVPGTAGAIDIDMPGQAGGFVARFEADGSFSWLTEMQNALVHTRGLACADDASCIVCVHYTQDLTIAPGLAGETVLPGASPQRMLATARISAGGALVWIRADAAAGTLAEDAAGVGVLPDGKSAVAGDFIATITVAGRALQANPAGFFFAIFDVDGSVAP
jgi:hypothetical protein